MCTSPLMRIVTHKMALRKNGKITPVAKVISMGEYESNTDKYEKYADSLPIACGQCTECRLQKAREWANRLYLEKQNYKEDECWYITLTYDDVYLPFHTTRNCDTGEEIEGVSLDKKHMQKFLRDLRRYYKYNYNIQGIRFFGCGEYGEETERPHMHLIMFGLPLDLTKLKAAGKNKLGQQLWTHEVIEKIWKKGGIKIGRVTWDSCCYVARYVMKKQTGENAKTYYKALGRIPPFVNMSRNPGIGRAYFEENAYYIYETDSIPIANRKTTELVKPPKAFDRWMEEYFQEEMEELKEKRRKEAEEREHFKNMLTDLSPEEQRVSRDMQIKNRTKILTRNGV